MSFKFEIDFDCHFSWQLGKKLRAALDAGLKVTYAIGELLEEREVLNRKFSRNVHACLGKQNGRGCLRANGDC